MSEPLRVLLIEDDADDVLLIRDSLSGRFAGGLDLRHFDRLEPALEAARADRVDVVLLDLSLPDSQGMATFEALQRARPEVPIIVLSGFDDENLALLAVKAGAQDYLIKAYVDDHLLVRSVRYAIERRRRWNAEQALRASEAKMRVAREIQQRLFPAEAPTIPGFDIAGASLPADAVGGDYFDFIPMGGGQLGIVVADVSGHGVGPSFLMAETRACLRSLALSLDDPAEILGRANRILTADTDDYHFVTLILAQLEAESATLVYSSAGHGCYVLSPDGQVQTIDSTGVPLGVDPEARFPCGEPVQLSAGQVLLFVTDGIAEARSEQGEMFGMERVFQVLRQCQNDSAQRMIEHLQAAARAHACGKPQQDDMTAVIVKVGQDGRM